MTDRKYKFTDARTGAALGVRVVTKSPVTEVAGKTEEGAVKIRLQAYPAGDAAANDELVQFLSEKLGVDVARIEIVAGENSRDKILSIEGISSADLESRLLP